VVFFFEAAKGFDLGFEPRDKAIVVSDEADEGIEGHAVLRLNPVGEEVEFGLGGAVTIGSQVVADPFDTVFEKIALLGVEGDTVLEEDGADTSEKEQGGGGVGGPEKGVVDNIFATNVEDKFGMTGGKEVVPFGLKQAHHSSVAGGSIARAERHDVEAVLEEVGGEKSEFLTVRRVDADLMKTGATVDADKMESTF
jgi:hypothetical protein